MAKTEIKIRVGNVQFSGCGEPEWLEQQLDKVLKVASALAQAPEESTLEAGSLRGDPQPASVRQWLQRAAGESGRLGAAAEWLTLRSRRG